MSGAPVSTSGDLVFAAAAPGTPLDCLALEASGGGAQIYGSHGNVTIRKTVFGRLHLLGHCTDSRLKHAQPFQERGLCARLRAQARGPGFWFDTLRRAPREHRLVDGCHL